MDNTPENLRGELCKWLMELKPGVFIGNVSSKVREKLWEKVCSRKITGAILVYNYNNEQGFNIQMHGVPRRQVIDLEGLNLIKVDKPISETHLEHIDK